MSSSGYGHIRVVAEARTEPLLPSGLLGMLIFLFTEAMLFAGLISAFTIVRASALDWPPVGQPRLPAEETAINTTALLLSAVMLILARRSFRVDRRRTGHLILAAIGLGAFFVLFQGAEWIAMLGQGLTLTSSTHGSFFYLIVGMHGLHAIIGLAVLVLTWQRLQRGWLASSQLATAEAFWYFVCGLWPLLYVVVYLA